MKKINLASGQRPFPEPWINADIRRQYKDNGEPYPCELLTDIRKLDKVEDNSVDVLVSHHSLEHIRLNDILDTSKEWHRVLKPGGKLAVFVPNLKELAKAWIEGRIDNFIFLVNIYGAYQGFEEDTHKWGFDFNELRDRMSGWDGKKNELEWSSVKDLNGGVPIDPAYDGADIACAWWILGVEFIK